MKRILIPLILVTCFQAFAQDIIIPDILLKRIVIKNYDLNNDHEIQFEEAQKVKNIIMEEQIRIWITPSNDAEYMLSTLEGIENFPNLEKIELYESHIKIVNFSKNKLLKSIKIVNKGAYTPIVNISQNNQLTEISLLNFDLNELILPKNAKLEKLELRGNQLSNLDISNYPSIKILNLSKNLFKHISVEHNTQLETFDCSNNWLYQIDISKLTKLKVFGAEQIGIASLNLKYNPQLESLYLANNHLKTIDISLCPNLRLLNIEGNRIYTIDNTHQKQLKIIRDDLDPSDVLKSYTSTNKFENKFNFKKDMVWLDKSNIYVAKYETTNEEYNDFLHHIIKDSLSKLGKEYIYYSLYPDTTLWTKEFTLHMGDPMMEYYFKHPQFADYPALAIDYWAAKKYCDWMTQKYGNGMYKFRLPTYDEYISYSKIGDALFAGGWNQVINEQNEFAFNFRTGIYLFKNDTIDSISNHETFFNPTNQLYTKVYQDKTKDWSYNGPDNFFKIDFIYENKIFYTVKNKLYSFKLEDKIKCIESNIISEKVHDKIIFSSGNHYLDGYMFPASNRIALNIKYNFKNLNKSEIAKLKFNKSTYPADKNGLFHVAGNVSEWINFDNKEYPNFTKGMGGNWNSFEQDCLFNSGIDVDKGFNSTTIGFRIVAEKIKTVTK